MPFHPQPKMMALVLVAVMMFAMGATALAAGENYSITVTNSNKNVTIAGKTYDAYKLFDLVYADTNNDSKNDAYAYSMSTSNQFYTNAATKGILEQYFTFTASSADSTKLVVTPKDSSTYYDTTTKNLTSEGARALADALQPYIESMTADGSTTVATGAETATINLAAAGYYLVYGTASNNVDGTSEVTAAVALTSTEPTATVNPKVDAPSVDKFDGSEATDVIHKATDVNVGDTVYFKVTSSVPTDMNGYSSTNPYKYVFHDTMSSGLTLNPNSFVIKIGDATLESSAYSVDTKPADGHTFDITIENMTIYTEGAAIEITYNAVLNDAAISTDEENNTVKLQYSNNPYDKTTTGETTEHTVYVYDFDILTNKYDGADPEKETKLEGATFVLYKNVTTTEGGEETTTKQYYKKTTDNKVQWVTDIADATKLTTDTNGKVAFTGLDVGTYYLHETEAPTGYNLLTTDPEVKVTATYAEDGTMSSSSATRTSTTTEEDGKTVTTFGQYQQTQDVENNTGSVLPSTGGIGTTIFYVIGAILVIGAGVILVTRKRMGNAK